VALLLSATGETEINLQDNVSYFFQYKVSFHCLALPRVVRLLSILHVTRVTKNVCHCCCLLMREIHKQLLILIDGIS
jgi:hypothetical protein